MQNHQHRWGSYFLFLFTIGFGGTELAFQERVWAQNVGTAVIPRKNSGKSFKRRETKRVTSSTNSFSGSSGGSTFGSEVIAEMETPKKEAPSKFSASYWSMFTGPAIGQSLDQSKTGDGTLTSTGSNYFQSAFVNYSFNANQVVGTQLRASTDMLRTPGATSVDFLNPRIYFHQKKVLDNSWMSMGLQPFVEIPTTSASRENTLVTSILFAQNFTFKVPNEKWMLLLTTMVNQHFYGSSAGNKRMTDIIAFPTVGYQINKTFQILGWAWFDWTRRSETPASMNDGTAIPAGFNSWTDNYARVGLNIYVLDNVQIMPCAQVFTDNLRADNTTFGFEISASI